MARLIDLGEEKYCWKTLKEATEFFQSILHDPQWEGKRPITGDAADAVALALLNHPDAESKIGIGIEFYYVAKPSNGKGTKCFHFVRPDGSIEHFSIAKALKGEEVKPQAKLYLAGRNAVQSKVEKVKRDYFEENQDNEGRVACQETGNLITYQEAHIDHSLANSFSVIAKNFGINLELMLGIKLSDVKYRNANVVGYEFEDEKIKNLFINAHEASRTLRVIKGSENLKKAFRARTTPTQKDLIS